MIIIFLQGEYHQTGESMEIPKQSSVELSNGHLQSVDTHDVDQQAPSSSGVKKSSQQRPMMGRVTSTLDSSARPRRPHFSPIG